MSGAAPTASEALLRKKLATRHRPKGFMEAILAEDPRETHHTLSPDQLRITMLALDMEAEGTPRLVLRFPTGPQKLDIR